ncbi:TetR/AcrR family transcriptional regulator [Geodermatophilus sp. TF02-6]|nr:TetR/AcrR family transcriptional regulator [Geodermatophilus sp. TF02-6]RBY83817.1 TetR/AcrR family transcriptional regulator [Geodermatophilus sp. TF02-6]
MTTAGSPLVGSSGRGRVGRRRARNRERLVSAAAELMAEAGVEGVTVSAITERADLGAGTFYNYFQSRDGIVDAVVAGAVETLGQRLDALTQGMADAAEIYSSSLRHLMRTAVTDPLWGRLVVRLGIAHDQLIATLGPRARRDLLIGVDSGRFQVPDVDIATAITFGALLSAIHAHLGSDQASDPSGVFAESLLRMVGIPAEEATEITQRPLPPLPSLEEARVILGGDAEG